MRGKWSHVLSLKNVTLPKMGPHASEIPGASVGAQRSRVRPPRRREEAVERELTHMTPPLLAQTRLERERLRVGSSFVDWR